LLQFGTGLKGNPILSFKHAHMLSQQVLAASGATDFEQEQPSCGLARTNSAAPFVLFAMLLSPSHCF
jgi:hypothetical protein